MAEETISKLKEQLKCSICLETYTDPKKLRCNHVYCQNCLARLVARNFNGRLSITCPNCRQFTILPAGGVAGLQTGFQFQAVLAILAEHKEAAEQSCPVHVEREVELYCESCDSVICYKCVSRGGDHHDHVYKELPEAFKKYKEEATAVLGPMEEHLETIEAKVDALNKLNGDITSQEEAIEANIHDTAKQLHENIDSWKDQILKQLDNSTKRKLNNIAAELRRLQTTQDELKLCTASMKESFGIKKRADFLSKTVSRIKKSRQLLSTFQPDQIIKADLSFSSFTDICAMHGQLVNCHATGKGLLRMTAHQNNVVTVHANSLDGKPVATLESLDCKLISEVTKTEVVDATEVKTTANDQGLFEISCDPESEGWHQLHITVGGQHIMGSPFRIEAEVPQPCKDSWSFQTAEPVPRKQGKRKWKTLHM